MEIDISHESESMEIEAPLERVEQLLIRISELVGKTECELSCSFVSDVTMQSLNREYRDKDESTDILSFVQSDGTEGFPYVRATGEPEVLGDIVISLESMKRNCEFFGVAPEEELARLLIHGVLHLTGWDHTSNDESEPMLIQQEALLKILQKESVA